MDAFCITNIITNHGRLALFKVISEYDNKGLISILPQCARRKKEAADAREGLDRR